MCLNSRGRYVLGLKWLVATPGDEVIECRLAPWRPEASAMCML